MRMLHPTENCLEETMKTVRSGDDNEEEKKIKSVCARASIHTHARVQIFVLNFLK